jgi:predicted DCC family thiol-disulfide oxidoreductase YuxK
LLIFDGRCGFCRIWIEYFRQVTGDRVSYAASQDVASQYPQIPPEAFSQAVQLVRADGAVASGARAVFEALDKAWIYTSVPGAASALEWAYRVVARNRGFFYWATRLTFGRRVLPARFAATQRLFLKLLAAVYAIAFASLAVQVTGLAGERGIAPASRFFETIAANFDGVRYFAVPSLFWWNASDGALRGGCWAGVALAAMLAAGYFERAALVLLYALYLSYSMAGQVFMRFQWDALLLEAGFLGIFFGHSRSQQRIVAWLYRLLVFRLYFLSGYVKLGSGDPSWHDLSALGYHYHTQPLPTALAWYADQLPAWIHRASTAATLGIELVCPFLVFAPRLWRIAGAGVLLALQVVIAATGNYTFFNLLTIALTLWMFDDRLWGRFLTGTDRISTRRARMAGTFLAIALAGLGALRLWETTQGLSPRPLAVIGNSISQFQIANSYGLFAVMTTTRPEIVLEGSEDGVAWRAYEFRYKPGDLHRAPRWAAPHQPRLDWQMWFAALDDYRGSPWFAGLVERLLQGSPEVLALLATNPFPERPPRYVRAMLYEYWFTDARTRAATRAWWKREPRGAFFPAVSLRGAQ